MNNSTTKCINGILRAGDLVITAPDDDYSCLIGRVLQINLLGSPEHDAETQNETDDVHVDFTAFDYSKQRIKEIEAVFSELYGMKKKFIDCPIDDAIMDPGTLIRITGIDDKRMSYLLESGYNAASYCFGILSNLMLQAEPECKPDVEEQLEILTDVLDTIESSVTLAGYEVMDGGRDWFIIRHGKSDTDFEIKVKKLY